MSALDLRPIAIWQAGATPPAFSPIELLAAAQRVREPAHVVRDGPAGRLGVGFDGQLVVQGQHNGRATYPLLATLPALYPEWLGDRSFLADHGVRFPYLAGAMANGIASTRLVIELARAGMLADFGAAGLTVERVAAAIDELEVALGRADDGLPWLVNLIHSPNQPELEAALVDLYLSRDVRRVSAAAFVELTPAVVRFAVSGLRQDQQGHIHRRRHLFAKISRPEVARHFLSPPPGEMLDALVRTGQLTADEARLARALPLAGEIIAEADSGGHTDNRPLTVLLPIILALRDALAAEHGFRQVSRVGAAGGLGTPGAVAAAFALGAAFVQTGSVNQAALESGLSDEGKRLLAQATLADVTMAPAADMFEQGGQVQVLSRGTLFGVRARRLAEVYRTCEALEAIPAELRASLERELFRQPLDQVWADTRRFFEQRDPRQVERAERDPRHKLALCCRSYLGRASGWAIEGDPQRRLDYQIWCGPAIGSFNAWVKGSFLEDPARREVVQIARNLLEGAAVLSRAQQLRCYGLPVPSSAFQFLPRPLS
ncbi:MAG: PfaD family polyunsaturated fatty acid/polyketide biosynthesis protein [Deltaproteobacteria bacterium]|nr:PfaD family polyunsaturated fatty acid/polyketide biosynthesis protein [Deltaproteobacteria bacterium]